jgi:hypothetical protein
VQGFPKGSTEGISGGRFWKGLHRPTRYTRLKGEIERVGFAAVFDRLGSPLAVAFRVLRASETDGDSNFYCTTKVTVAVCTTLLTCAEIVTEYVPTGVPGIVTGCEEDPDPPPPPPEHPRTMPTISKSSANT